MSTVFVTPVGFTADEILCIANGQSFAWSSEEIEDQRVACPSGRPCGTSCGRFARYGRYRRYDC